MYSIIERTIRLSRAAAIVVFATGATLLQAGGAIAQPTTLLQYRALAISPDGKRVATIDVLEAQDTAIPDAHGQLVIRDAHNGVVIARHDPCTKCSYAGLTWSPDGRMIAFIESDAAAGTAALMVTSANSTRILTTINGVASTPRWSPNGQQVALLAVTGAHKAIDAVEAGQAQVGEIGSADDEQRIGLVAIAGGEIRFVSPADTFVYEYDWTPDGRGFVATAARGNGDNNWWIAKLVAIDAAGGAVRVVAAPSFQMDAPRVSPDGKRVLFIGGLMSDFGAVGGDLFSVPFSGGVPFNLTAGAAATVTSLVWRGRNPVVTRLVGEQFEISRVALGAASAKLLPIWSGAVSGQAGDAFVAVAANGRGVASVISDFGHPPEINVSDMNGALRPITAENAGHPPLVRALSINWTSDGRAVQGWLLAPLTAPAGKSAMIVEIHGGPSSAATPGYVWSGLARSLLNHGYYIFRPNPRGSYGQGEAFTRANVRDFGGGDLRDIQGGIDAVLKIAPIDPERLGVYGHSYGGFMSMWTVTHSTRFKAAVAGAGIANWISYYGQNGIDQWMIPFFGASAYDDPDVYRADSPISSIKAAKTPTLIYVGERDVECPPAQSVEFWHGLKAMNVPTSLVIYEGAGHHLRKPDQIHDRETRIVEWFDRLLH